LRYVRVENTGRGSVLGTRVGIADGWWSRFRGLSGRTGLSPGEGLILRPCRAIHMLGMSFDIDVAFLNDRGAVVASYHALRPWRRTRWHSAAVEALELPAGTLSGTGTREGDTLVCTEVGL
jgi:uncharacterized membrane protein (UPF0127 family)